MYTKLYIICGDIITGNMQKDKSFLYIEQTDFSGNRCFRTGSLLTFLVSNEVAMTKDRQGDSVRITSTDNIGNFESYDVWPSKVVKVDD